MTFHFIEAHKDQWPVRLLCETLEVSPAGYYAWRGRPRSAGEQRQDTLLVAMRAIQIGAEVPCHDDGLQPQPARGRQPPGPAVRSRRGQ
jgi:hypothetical protein